MKVVGLTAGSLEDSRVISICSIPPNFKAEFKLIARLHGGHNYQINRPVISKQSFKSATVKNLQRFLSINTTWRIKEGWANNLDFVTILPSDNTEGVIRTIQTMFNNLLLKNYRKDWTTQMPLKNRGNFRCTGWVKLPAPLETSVIFIKSDDKWWMRIFNHAKPLDLINNHSGTHSF